VVLGRFSRGLEFTRISFGVLWKDKELLIFPTLSLIAVSIFIVGFIYDAFMPGNLLSSGSLYWLAFPTRIAAYVSSYLILSVVTTYLNVGLISCVKIGFEGGKPTLRDGFEASNRNFKSILEWALLSATVGMVFTLIEGKLKGIGKVITGVARIGWVVATYFAVPVLIFENMPPLAAVKRSAELFKRTWGEMAVGGVSMGALVFLLWIPGIILAVIVGIAMKNFMLLLIMSVLSIIPMAVVSSAAGSILNVALYRYATTGNISQGFSQNALKDPWGKSE